MNITIVVGTRPETIKMAPVIRELKKQNIPFTFIHSGQHYDYNMSLQFIKELNLPNPDYTFKLNNCNPASQIGEMMTKLEETLQINKSTLILIQGDTNTMLATALTGVKLGTKIGHIEAGLRSYDWRMPEEHNRRMVDHISDHLFAPTETAKQNLTKEQVYGKIHVTGNTIIDAINQHLPIAEKHSKIMQTINYKEYALATLHRAENVDNPKTLKNIIETFMDSPIPMIFPIHPRTTKKLQQLNLFQNLKNNKNIQLTPPLGYFDFLILMKHSKIILTDSGGIQEEATSPHIKKHVLVLRLSTERPEAVETGFAKIVGVNKNTILKNLNKHLNEKPNLPSQSPFGDGKTSQKIIKTLMKIT
ncbi:MAG: UDP-N-acetylglucosamine 2-epimerase (non-hydrolyzing) [Candidatus Bathyarchaeota archaeon]|nr:MAG: UDP-N-acetylglucosamine 2-epimerase (non-hydrolyzing) [Candidatus Bathyarchaeota archaeon]